MITTVAGNGFIHESGDGGPAISAQFNRPTAVSATSSGNIYIGDGFNYTVCEVSSAGTVTRVAGNGTYGYSGDGGPGVNAQIVTVDGVVADPNGNVYIADTDNLVIRKLAVDGTITTYAGNGTFGYSGDGQPATSASISYAEGLAVDRVGNLYIADTGNCVVCKVDLTKTITTVVGQGTCGFSGDGGPAGAALLSQPFGLTFDDQGNLFIADAGNSRIREVSATTGLIATIAGDGLTGYSGDGGPATSAELRFASGVAVDGSENVYIADQINGVVRKVSLNGIITTIAGTGAIGYSGDNGPALDAVFGLITGIAVGTNGTVYVADEYNNEIRELNICPVTVSPVAADSNAQTLSSPLAAASTCSWVASNLPSWITSASSGTGPGMLSLTFQANTTGADRSATMIVNGLSVGVSQAFTVEQFQDVPAAAYYFDAVNLLKGKMITAGCGPTDYCPTQTVTRAEMAIFIVRAVVGGDNFTYSPTPHFTDVQATDFGFGWIQKLYELGITGGCGPGFYCPNDSITRAQMAIFIIRARYGATTVFDYPTNPYFTDVPNSGFAFTYIQRMKEDNITAGCSATTYCPDNPVTRGDMAIFIMRGGFNQLLPATEATIVSVSPATVTNGVPATVTITGSQTHFSAGTILNAVPGLAVSGVTVVNATTLTATVTGNAATTPQPISIWVTDAMEEAVLPNGLGVQ